eukprot:CAMPEP_0179926746 /NCGR_PEP_ID=MMETSP0983-20121128/7947_1 /TAXON_ID=483367 /ORGANISM="non described non described, Strain CCMP 2436" /LENGTH=764 /DNA_ID=CAMNT_0021830401 /DNA_START=10 /DNA_END=2304 /DNA_ORIENTATION=+
MSSAALLRRAGSLARRGARGVRSSDALQSSAVQPAQPSAPPAPAPASVALQLDEAGFVVLPRELPSMNGVDFKQQLHPQYAETVEVFIDGHAVQVQKGGSILQACEQIGIQIPRFCYHERLSVAGNCRMCLVEIEKAPKPVAACAMPAAPGMKIFTNSPIVKKAREGVMEFLLANHPLDCPICDQGGECDLQDQAMYFGSDRGRTQESRRGVEDKNLGPLVKTVMTRCIHCTRCVRFATEVAGVDELGTVGRGNAMEIGTYVERMLDSELSGNIVDLCPVGALTSKPYAFTSRPWELRTTDSVDVLDGMGSNIRVDTRGGEVMRILPRLNEEINEEWIADKTRYAYDGLKRQRLDTPLIRPDPALPLQPASWKDALDLVAAKFKATPGARIGAFAGSLADAESMIALKDLCNSFNSDSVFCDVPAGLSSDCRAAYTLGSGIAGVEEADAVLLLATNLKTEAPLLNARLRKRVFHDGVRVAAVGPNVPLTYEYEHLGDSVKQLLELANGTHPFCKVLASAKRPLVLVGSGAFERTDAAGISWAIRKLVTSVPSLLQPDWNGFGTVQPTAAAVGALDLGLMPIAPAVADAAPFELVYLLGYDAVDLDRLSPDAFVVYQGHHGDLGAETADVILPGSAYTEKVGTFANMEGRSQRTARAVSPPGEARDDWKILRAVSELAGKPLSYACLDSVRERLAAVSPALADMSEGLHPVSSEIAKAMLAVPAKAKFEFDAKTPLASCIQNYYMTDAISRASATMASCTKAFGK